MTQIDAAGIWKKGAREALESSDKLFELKKFDHSLFMLHLAIEKSLKAAHIKLKNEAAPYTHNLVRLAEKAGIDVNEQTQKDLVEISGFNVTGRYEDYKNRLYKRATLQYTSKWKARGKELFDLFMSKL